MRPSHGGSGPRLAARLLAALAGALVLLAVLAATASAASDPLTLRSPLCAPGPRAALPADQRRACERSGSPVSGVPTVNYAFDIHWNPPVTRPAEVAVRTLYEVLDTLWVALLFVVRGALTLLDWAFSLNPFDAGSSGELAQTLERFGAVIEEGYLSALIVALGLWGIWNGLVRGRTPETLGGLAAAVALLALALATIHAPDRTAGLVARLANQAAMGLMAAPSHGVDAAPVASYAEAVDGLFDDLVRGPWCALQFRTERFCMGTAEAAAVQATLEAAEDDAVPPGAKDPRPSRGELWLAFAPGSEPRAALHDFYAGKDGGRVGAFGVTIINTPIGDKQGHDPEQVALQGADGTLVRLPLLVVLVLGILGALCLLLWLTVRLLDQAITGFVLLLLTPLALLLVAFGETGRAAFVRWALALLGALVSKAVYAALFGVIVAASQLLSATDADGTEWMLGWLLQTAFWWSVFFRREKLIGYLSVVPSFDGRRPRSRLASLLGYRVATGALLGAGIGGGATRAGGPLGKARGIALRTRVARSEATRTAGREHLERRAEQRATQHDRDAHDVLARDRSLRDALDALTIAPRDGGTAGPTPGGVDPPTPGMVVPPDPIRPARDASTSTPSRLDGTSVGQDPSAPRAARRPATPDPATPRVAAPATLTGAAPSATGADTAARAAALSAERAALAPRVALAREAATTQGRPVDERERRRERLDQVRRELDLPAQDLRHAWRVGLSPDALLRLRTEAPAQHAAHVLTIADQLTADRTVASALPTDPRTPPRPSAERAAAAHLDPARLDALRRDTRDRLRHERNTRRYLYR